MKYGRWASNAACGVAIVVATVGVGCNRSDTVNTPKDTLATGTSGSNAEKNTTPVTISGCLQKTGGLNNFVITQANRMESVGTSGAAGSNSVENKEIVAASKSYRLSGGDNDELNNMIGKQVRVVGTLTERAHIVAQDNDKSPAVDADDLAKVDIQSVTKTVDACASTR